MAVQGSPQMRLSDFSPGKDHSYGGCDTAEIKGPPYPPATEGLGSLYRDVTGEYEGRYSVGAARRFLQGLGADE